MNYKNYLFSLAPFFLAAFLIFAFSIVIGYFFAQNNPAETERILSQIQGVFEGAMGEGSQLNQFIFIFLNNTFTLLLIIVLGIIFGIFPLASLFVNGLIMGILAHSFFTTGLTGTFFLGILPHGIVEIPVFLLAGAVGFKIAKTAFNNFLGKDGSLKEEYIKAFNFFFKILLPLLFLAALLETFLTAGLLS